MALIGLGFMVLFFTDLRSATFDPTHARLSGVKVAALDRLLLLLLALAVVASLQSVGLLMSVAMLVTPPSTARMLSAALPNIIVISSSLGVACGTIGLIASYHLSTPPGATIALVLSSVFVLVAIGRSLRVRSGPKTLVVEVTA
jgi:ABC-type Mn2+/Zn2+ transport system permease subunit